MSLPTYARQRNRMDHGADSVAEPASVIATSSAAHSCKPPPDVPNTTEPRVVILLCSHDGQAYLTDQLESFEKQSHRNWSLCVSDDESKDATLAILQRFQRRWGPERLSILQGPNNGSSANFLSLACDARIEADYFAFSDQDDIWEDDKLERALQVLSQVAADVPAIYCSRTRIVDRRNEEIGLSPLFRRHPSFANALVQNIAGGNTMVYNAAARDVLCKASKGVQPVSHDWWVYMVVTGCGGQVYYDDYPSVRYRQHDNNLVGANSGWRARLTRLTMLLKGRFRTWNSLNTSALKQAEHLLTPDNRELLNAFIESRDDVVLSRMKFVMTSQVYRQTRLGGLALLAAAILRKY